MRNTLREVAHGNANNLDISLIVKELCIKYTVMIMIIGYK